MLDKILQIEEKYTQLGTILSDPAVIADYEKFRDLSKQKKSHGRNSRCLSSMEK